MLKGIIYKVCNKINSKVYIGQTYSTNKYKSKSSTVLLKNRKKKHYYKTKNNKMNNHFLNALNKYEEEVFQWEVLACCYTIDNLNYLESFYINSYSSFSKGYNSTTGGENYIISDETKEKFSQISKQRMTNYLNTEKGLSNQREHYQKFLNNKEARKNNKASIRAAYAKPFVVLDLKGNIIAEFEIIKDCSEAFNTTPSTVSAHLKKKYKSNFLGKYTLEYVSNNGKVLPGLVKRRKAEAELAGFKI